MKEDCAGHGAGQHRHADERSQGKHNEYAAHNLDYSREVAKPLSPTDLSKQFEPHRSRNGGQLLASHGNEDESYSAAKKPACEVQVARVGIWSLLNHCARDALYFVIRHVVKRHMTESTPITEPVLLILLSLAEQPRHGYSILKDVEEISEGRVRLST